MSSATLLSGVLTSAAVRRKRQADGRLYAVADVRDTDRGGQRYWRVYLNDLELIERVEEMRVGEPIAISGPFYFSVEGTRIVHRITAEALIDIGAGASRKGKSQKSRASSRTSSISHRVRQSRKG